MMKFMCLFFPLFLLQAISLDGHMGSSMRTVILLPRCLDEPQHLRTLCRVEQLANAVELNHLGVSESLQSLISLHSTYFPSIPWSFLLIAFPPCPGPAVHVPPGQDDGSDSYASLRKGRSTLLILEKACILEFTARSTNIFPANNAHFLQNILQRLLFQQNGFLLFLMAPSDKSDETKCKTNQRVKINLILSKTFSKNLRNSVLSALTSPLVALKVYYHVFASGVRASLTFFSSLPLAF